MTRQRLLVEGTDDADARVVDQQVDRRLGASDALGDALELGAIRKVGLDDLDLDLDRVGPQFGGKRLEEILPTRHEDEVRSFAGQQASELGADAGRCARDECSFPTGHRDSLVSVTYPAEDKGGGGGRESNPPDGDRPSHPL